ncbi:ABC transporter ATP-binding protein [Aliiroseovarius sp. PTFE2010]|uniref:ABC transporter ATP-binding protein n=1 Tax=Aliiroseovarius sp. PTFE2010 TaxID=3417190 RepID=UPI003CF2E257
MLSVQNVSKSYELKGVRKNILQDLSFDFPDGKNCAIMGRNGAGKSTFMRLLAGTEPPDSGRIYRSARVSWPLGFAGGFNGSMTGIENVRFVARIYGQDTEAVIQYVKDFSELGPSLKLPIKTYSSGMKARLAFGLSMAIDFEMYLIDEITAVGDEQFKKKSQAVFNEKLGKSQIIMISHSANTIRDYCDCGILLEHGRIRYFSHVDDLLKEYRRVVTA